MNTYKLLKILEEYLVLLQQQNADDAQITDLKLMIWAIDQDIKLKRFINNLTTSNKYYKR